jgi:hypothetical protein
VRWVIGRQADLDAIAGNHADPEAPHPSGQLRGDRLPAVELDLIAAPAENFLDSASRLDQIVAGQWKSSESARKLALDRGVANQRAARASP